MSLSETQKRVALELYRQGKTWPEITQGTGAGVEDVRGYLRTTQEYKDAHKTDKPVGVISDTHIPFQHPNYLQFVKDTFRRHGVGRVVCIGDLVDHHALSRHQTETCAKSATDEFTQAKQAITEYAKAFPKVSWCIGNHDRIVERQAATLGIGTEFLKPINELYGLPKTWEIGDEFIINGVLYKHGLNCAGKDGALNAALIERMSTVIGHYHSNGGVKYSANKRSIIFGLQVGCGIDVSAYAFAYGQHAKYRPTIGCGIVYSETCAMFVPMSKDYFRD